MTELKFYKTSELAHSPTVGTQQSACFDLKSFLGEDDVVYYTKSNNKQIVKPIQNREGIYYIDLIPKYRYLIPTGLILDIPVGHSVRIHPRSGLSLKNGLGLANMEGIIDSDYVDPLYILLVNNSEAVVRITDGMRVCQGEMIKDLDYEFNPTDIQPVKKTDRDGGLGSTGH